MARQRIDIKPNKPITTAAFSLPSDWVNRTNTELRYIPFEDGDAESVWPADDDDVKYGGLPWPTNGVIPVRAGERIHVLARSGQGGRIEGFENGA